MALKSQKDVIEYFGPIIARAEASPDKRAVVPGFGEQSLADIVRNFNVQLDEARENEKAGKTADSSGVPALLARPPEDDKDGKGGKPAPGGGGKVGGGGKGGVSSGGFGGKGGTTKKAPEPAAPPPRPLMVSFGKVFCSFCLPPILANARKDGIDEVQVNFYQMNESCGPMSLHSVAEFPILIDELKDEFSTHATKRGGESMTVFEFMQFINSNVFQKNRAPGYGMRTFTEPQDANKPADAKKDDSAKQDSNKMSEFYSKYGVFKQPNVVMKIDTLYEGDDGGGVDLLYKLQHTVGAQYNAPPPDFETDPAKKKKRIKRVNIYDSTYNPYAKTGKVFKDSDGYYRAFEGNPDEDKRKSFIEAYKRQYAESATEFGLRDNRVTINGVTVSPPIASGYDVLKNYLGDSLPVITVGTNGSMVVNASVSSKTAGLASSINLTGGSFKATSTISPNGLSMADNNLPIRALPAEMTMTTMGCPVADARQQFYVDFGTATTIDNIYTSKQIQHNFSPGKFETAWTFIFSDGYSKFFGATGIADEITALKKEKDEQPDPPPQPEPPEPAPSKKK